MECYNKTDKLSVLLHYLKRTGKQMRIVKEAEERRTEILDVAERLFDTKGFDQTSTNDILNEIGIARGTLYYHFKSKEDILDAVTGRAAGRLVGKARGIAESRTIPVLQRLAMTILTLNGENTLGWEMAGQCRPQNALMQQKLRRQLLLEVNPLITRLVEEGVEQGVCQTVYPKEAVEMAMLYSGIAFDDLMEDGGEDGQRKIKAFIYHLERLFGIKEDSLADIMTPFFRPIPTA